MINLSKEKELYMVHDDTEYELLYSYISPEEKKEIETLLKEVPKEIKRKI